MRKVFIVFAVLLAGLAIFCSCNSSPAKVPENTGSSPAQSSVLPAGVACLQDSLPISRLAASVFDDPAPTPTMTADVQLNYNRCVAYELFWADSFHHWPYLMQLCSSDEKETTVSWLHFVTTLDEPGPTTIETLLNAWFCYDYIKNEMDDLWSYCQMMATDFPTYYLPDVVTFAGYNPATNKFTLDFINGGHGFAYSSDTDPNIYEVYFAHTANPDRQVTIDASGPSSPNFFTLKRVPSLSPPNRFYSGVPDTYFEDVINVPLTPGEYNEVLVVFDRENHLLESDKTNNSYRVVVDLIPKPTQFKLSTQIEPHLGLPSLTDHWGAVLVTNTGQVTGTAFVSLYDGQVEPGETPLQGPLEMDNLQGGASQLFTWQLSTTPEEGSPYLGSSHLYTVRVVDAAGVVHDEMPLRIYPLAGRISGCVDDAQGNGIAGVEVDTEGSSTTTTGSGGCYVLKVGQVGTTSVVAWDPDYPESQRKVVELTYAPDANGDIPGLEVDRVDFNLGDKIEHLYPLSITVKEGSVNLGQVSYEAIRSPDGRRLDGIFDSPATLQLPAGDFVLVVSKAGYQPQQMFVSGVSSTGSPSVYFSLVRDNYRRNDDGLTITAPVKLWELDIQGHVSGITSSKSGNWLAIYLEDLRRQNPGKILFLDALTGQVKSQLTWPVNEGVGVGGSLLRMDYSGNLTGFYYLEGARQDEGNTNNSGVYMLSSTSGQVISLLKDPIALAGSAASYSVPFLEVSPDGLFTYITHGLYTNQMIPVPSHKNANQVVSGAIEPEQYGGTPIKISRYGYVVAPCNEGGVTVLCQLNMAGEPIGVYNIPEAPRMLDVGETMVAAAAYKGLYLKDLAGDGWFKTWQQVLGPAAQQGLTWGGATSLSVSPGGSVVMLAGSSSGSGAGDLWVFNASGEDITPLNSTTKSERILMVSANDTGLFYLVEESDKKLAYYQMGTYGQVSTQTPTPTSPTVIPPSRPPTDTPTLAPPGKPPTLKPPSLPPTLTPTPTTTLNTPTLTPTLAPPHLPPTLEPPHPPATLEPPQSGPTLTPVPGEGGGGQQQPGFWQKFIQFFTNIWYKLFPGLSNGN